MMAPSRKHGVLWVALAIGIAAPGMAWISWSAGAETAVPTTRATVTPPLGGADLALNEGAPVGERSTVQHAPIAAVGTEEQGPVTTRVPVLPVPLEPVPRPLLALPGEPVVPVELLEFYRVLQIALADATGDAAKSALRREKAVASLMERGSYWFVGDKQDAPAAVSTAEVQFSTVHFAPGKVAIFALTRAEFPEIFREDEAAAMRPSTPLSPTVPTDRAERVRELSPGRRGEPK
jgi:hypothetical protein